MSTPGVADSESVCVAVHVRPLIDLELDQGCRECLEVTPGEPQVGNGPHRFTYDHVFGGDSGQDPQTLYGRCVEPLVDGLFKGYNATVFAYGQTGSGKTYTMGSSFEDDAYAASVGYNGVIPRAMEAIFARIAESDGAEFTVRVGFVEIHKEEIRDLLARRQAGGGVMIRELPSGGIVLAGTVEKEVKSREEMVRALQEGTALRATAETGMNKRSSRSHAIFTITLEQRRLRPDSGGADGDSGESDDGDEDDLGLDDYLCAKMHLVDLAGSERAKRTKAEGARLQEGININKGLLALGNVINALSEGKAHVPYRDSKLTRMLQDSLGGNSRTVMIACVSPADVNLEESLNTLRYASRARAIKNKPVVNRDPVAAHIAALRQQLAAAKAENLELRKRLGLSAGDEVEYLASADNEDLRAALRESEAKVAALQAKLVEARAEGAMLREQLKAAQEAELLAALQRDKLAAALAAAAGDDAAAAALEEAAVGGTAEAALAAKVHELEDEVRRLRLRRVRGLAGVPGTPGSAGLSPAALSPLSPGAGGLASPFSPAGPDTDPELLAEEEGYRAEMARVQSEMDLLEKQLESKEARIAEVSGHSTMKENYETQLRDLAAERDALAKERAGLLAKLRSLQAASHEERVKMERSYKARIKELDARAKSVDKQEVKIRGLEAAQKRALESVAALKTDVQRIKEQKAALQRHGAQAAKEFAAWKKDRDREVAHLKKEGRANAAQLMRMEALHAKQLEVLRRKTEEAAAARKRLQVLEGRRGGRTRSGGRPVPGVSVDSGDVLSVGSFDEGAVETAVAAEAAAAGTATPMVFSDESTRREWVESELDTCCSSYELQKVLEGEKALRSEAARQLREVERRLAALKNPEWWGTAPGRDGDRDGGEDALLKKRAKLASAAERHGRQIQEVQLALVQARAREEERGGGAADPSRWASFASVNELRSVLTTTFRSASQYKAQAYEAQLALTEMSEEVEMLRLKLEVSEAEKLEAAMRAAEAQATAEALVSSHLGPSEGETESGSATGAAASVGGVRAAAGAAAAAVSDSHDREAVSALRHLEKLSGDPRAANETSASLVMSESLPEAPEEGSADVADAADGPVSEEPAESEYDEDEDHFDDYESSDGDEEEGDAWDPSQATPIAETAKKVRRPRGERGQPSVAELAALEHLNAARAARGEPPVAKLTVSELRTALKGQTVRGEEWRAGSKKRREMMDDYIALMTEQAVAQAGGLHAPVGAALDAAAAETPTKAAVAAPLAAAPANGIARQASVGSTGTPRRSPLSKLMGGLMRTSSKASQASVDSAGGGSASAGPAAPSGRSSGKGNALSRMLVRGGGGSGRSTPTSSAATAPPVPQVGAAVASTASTGAAPADAMVDVTEASLRALKLGRTSSHDGQPASAKSVGSTGSGRPAWIPS